MAMKLAGYYGIKKEKIIDLAFWLILGGVVGARVYHVFLEWPFYLSHPLNIFKVWQGGLAIHGAIIAGLVIIYIFGKKNRISFWLLAAIIAPGLALGQSLGRWGNYFNQELFGYPTDLPWGIPVDFMNRPLEFISVEFFHPTFLYESFGNFLIFLILLAVHVWIIKKKEFKQSRYALCVMCYAIFYSLLRFFIEFIRLDSTPEFLGLRWPQVASLIIIILSLAVLVYQKLPFFKTVDKIKSIGNRQS